jgi:hypothetical protein
MSHSALMKASERNELDRCSVSSFLSRTDGKSHNASLAHLTEEKIAADVVRASDMDEGP